MTIPRLRHHWLLSSWIAVAAAYSLSAHGQSIATVTASDIEALVSSNEGKVVVVNFWATWCPPCLREFPDIVEVYDRYHSEGLEVMAVSMNEADEVADIEEFLQKFEPPFTIYRAATVDETFYEGVVPSWFGEMPMTLIFDTTGKPVHIHKKPLTVSELTADVVALLPSR
jgi:thiol-disulfide isomerase/thioredoxin